MTVVGLIGFMLMGLLVAATEWSAFIANLIEQTSSTLAAGAIAITLFILLRDVIEKATRTRTGTAIFCLVLIVVTVAVCWVIAAPSGGFTSANVQFITQYLLQAISFVAVVFLLYRFLMHGWRGLLPFARRRETR